ncbi:hypothetical protein NY78_3410 [Desulfovibrio sp. TomC]|nr:hypothetical protein NY78_3410 [Desulfovibrio sp. TomC]
MAPGQGRDSPLLRCDQLVTGRRPSPFCPERRAKRDKDAAPCPFAA